MSCNYSQVREGRAHLKMLLVLAQARHLKKGQQAKLAGVFILPFAAYGPGLLRPRRRTTKFASTLVILIFSGVKRV